MTVIHWNNPVSGDWSNPANWAPAQVPGLVDDVFIDAAGTYTVTVNSAEAAHSLTINNGGATVQLNATLSLGTTLDLISGIFVLNFGGTILGGTITGTGLRFAGGTLSGVAYDGPLDMSAASSNLHVTNGIVLTGTGGSGPGSLALTGINSILYFNGTQTLDNAAVSIGGSTGYAFLYETGASGTLTLGTNLDMTQTQRLVRLSVASGDAIVNQGTILAGVSSGTFAVRGGGSLVNRSLISVSGGDYLYATSVQFTNAAGATLSVGAGAKAALGSSGDTFNNQGTITVGNGAVLHLNGSFSQGNIGALTNSGGTVAIDGTLQNSGSVLSTGSASSFGLVSLSGAVVGGTVAGGGMVFAGGTLSGVEYDGPLDLSAAGSSLHVTNGIALTGTSGTGPGSVLLTGGNSRLYANGPQTLDNAAVSIGGSSAYAHLYVGGAAGTLTLGPNLGLTQTGRFARLGVAAADAVINQGTILAGVANGTFYFLSGGTLINQGLIAVSGSDYLGAHGVQFTNAPGGALALGAGSQAALGSGGITFTNQGTITVGSGAVLHLGGNFSQGNIGALTNSGGTVEIAGTLQNSGSVLSTGSASSLGLVSLRGAVVGGTISGGGMQFAAGTLSGATYDGPLNLSPDLSNVRVTNGIVLTGTSGTGPGSVLLTGANSRLYFAGTQTLDNAAVSLGGSSSYAFLYEGTGGTLTLGPNLGLTQTGRFARLHMIGPSGAVVNQGTILAGVSSGTFYALGGGSLVNESLIGVSGGDYFQARAVRFTNAPGATLSVGAASQVSLGAGAQTFNNQGTITVGSGAVLHLGGNFSQGNIGALTNSGGTIALQGTLQNGGSVLSTGSASSLGLVSLTGAVVGGTAAGAGIAFAGGTLSGVTYDGPLNLSTGSSLLHVTNGIVLTGTSGTGPGNVLLTGANSRLYFSGAQTLDNAAVSIGGSSSYAFIYEAGAGGTLTLGANLGLTQTGAAARLSVAPGDTVINQGTILAGVSGLFYALGSGSLVNQRLINVSGGDYFRSRSVNFTNTPGAILAVGAGSQAALGLNSDTFTNQGTITVGSGAVLHLAGSFSQANIGALTNSGGTISIQGTLQNSGSVLSTGSAASLGAVSLVGTLVGGTVAGGGMLFGGGTLSGVTYDGPLNLSPTSANVHVTNGIVLTGTGGTGPGTVLLNGNGSRLYFQGTQNLDNATVNIGGTTSYSFLYERGAGGTLTLGPNLVMTQTGRLARLSMYSTDAIVNQGTIVAGVSSGTFYALGGVGSLVNQGLISVSGGDYFRANSTILGNGTISLATNGTALLRTVGSGETIDFRDATGTLMLNQPTAFNGAVVNFRPGDTIDFEGIGLATTYTYSGGVLSLFNNGGTQVGHATLSSAIGSPHFTLTPDGASGMTVGLSAVASGSVFLGTYTSGIVLSNPTTQNPATVASTGLVTNTTTAHGGDGVYGTNAAAWTLSNFGTIAATSAASAGVDLRAGGSVSNAGSNALISGYVFAISIGGGVGSIANSGTIAATGGNGVATVLFAGGTVSNLSGGRISGGTGAVYIGGGAGAVTNASGGVIGARDYGVYIYGNSGSVSNAGTISGTGGTTGYGIFAYGAPGLAVDNLAGGTIVGASTGIYMRSSAAGILNLGSIAGIAQQGVKAAHGGAVVNGATAATTASITGYYEGIRIEQQPGDASNFATIGATGTAGDGVLFLAGGNITNAAGGVIQAPATGITVTGGVGSVFNFGLIAGIGGAYPTGVYLADGFVQNAATIAASGPRGAGIGVQLDQSGTIVNQNGALLYGADEAARLNGAGTLINSGRVYGDSGVDLESPSAALVNFGTIVGRYVLGVYLYSGASVQNAAGGLIVGYYRGVANYTGNATLTNGGTVVGGGGTAVGFLGAGNRLVVQPGAVFVGGVQGGGGGSDTLELAAGLGTGSLTGLGGTVAGFDQVLVDSSATWQLYGAVVGAGTTLSDLGTLSVAGPGGNYSAIDIGAGASLTVDTMIGNGTIAFTGANGQLTINGTVMPTNAIGGIAPSDAIDFRSLAYSASHSANYNALAHTLVVTSGSASDTLSVSGVAGGTQFGVYNDGFGGTLVRARNTGMLINGTYTSGIVLSNPTTQNPSTVTSGSYVTNTTTVHNGDAVYGTNAAAWDLINYGTLVGSRAGASGVLFRAGGTVVNTGLVAGYLDGVSLQGAAAAQVFNSGTIAATETVTGGPTLFSFGIIIAGSGSITNSGFITAAGHYNAIALQLNNGGTLNNTGTISNAINTASTTTNAVQFLNAGGVITNGAGGLISGYDTGVGFFPAGTIANPGTLTIVNQGVIESTQLNILGTIGGEAIRANGTNSGLILDNFGQIRNSQTQSLAGNIGGGGVSLASGTIVNEAGASINAVNGNAISVSFVTGAGVAISNLGTISSGDPNHSNIYVGRGGGTIVNYGAAALISGARSAISFGTTGGAGVVLSSGTIVSTGTTGGSAVYFGQGGTITNQIGGLVAAYRTGVSIKGATGTVTNAGGIFSNGTYFSAVYLGNGGAVTNAAGGYIESGWVGVSLNNTAGTVVNFGTIVSTASILNAGTLKGNAVHMSLGGFLFNGLGGALISGYEFGVSIGTDRGIPQPGGVGTVVNYGIIRNTGTGANAAPGIRLGAGGTIVTHGSILGYGSNAVDFFGIGADTIANFGVVENFSDHSAIYSSIGGIVTNEAGGLVLSPRTGISFNDTAGTAVSFGTVVNFGTVASRGTTAGSGVYFGQGGILNNYVLITAYRSGVSAHNTAAAVINSGTIVSTGFNHNGVYLQAGGTITNRFDGLIVGTNDGVDIAASGATVTNAGTIVGAGGIAVVLTGAGNRLVVDPGASFVGNVLGGSGGNDVLELAPGSGVLGGVGYSITGFDQITVDAGANWQISGTSIIVAGETVSDGGTLTFTSSLDNDGLIAIGRAGRLVLGGGASGAGVIGFSDGSALEVDGAAMPAEPLVGFAGGNVIDLRSLTFTATSTVSFDPNTNTLTVNNGATVDQLTLTGILAGTQFVVSADGLGGTNIRETGPFLANGLGGAAGFGPNVLGPNDDSSTGAIDITAVFPGGLNFFGTVYTSLYINNNGNITFNGPLSSFTPGSITAGIGNPIIAPFWADVDTRGGATASTGGNATGSDLVYWSLDSTDGVFTATWDDVGYFGGHTDKADAFQLQLVNLGAGDFEIVFRYQSINWTTGDASSGSNGLGGTVARAGYNSGTGSAFELAQSGSENAMLNLPEVAASAGTQGSTGQPGLYVFFVHNGLVAPPPPTSLALSSASDSGVSGDNDTNVVTPTISGFGEAGDTVTLLDGGIAVGSGVAALNGFWTVTVNQALGDGLHNLTAIETNSSGVSSAQSLLLGLTIDTTAPQTAPDLRTITATASGAPLGITAPFDTHDPANALTIIVTGLPSNGTVTLANGVTPVAAGQQLTLAQLTSLEFTPGANQAGSSSTFAYSVTDLAGNTGQGGVTLSVIPGGANNLFDFLFVYNDGRDYYFGTVADDGSFGYHVGQTIATAAGSYSVFAAAGTTTQASGTVFVADYSHGGPGQASPIPVRTAVGLPDSTTGLLSVSDAVRGTDGQNHPFGPNTEASFAATPLFGFVYAYADGASFYSGTVADDGSFGIAPGTRTVTGQAGNVVGTYTIFADGFTTRSSGNVVVDRFTVVGPGQDASGHNSFIPGVTAIGGTDGASGLGSEADTITVNGVTFGFSDRVEPAVVLSIPGVPLTPPPPPADVFAAEVNQIFADVLGRNPSPAEQSTYAGMLAAGASPTAIRQTLAQSGEGQADLNQLYLQTFNQGIGAADAAAYTNLIASGSSLAAVQLILAQSGEAASAIQQIFGQVLGRAADGAEVLTYEGMLASHDPSSNSLGGVRQIIAHSPESGADLNQIFLGTIGRTPNAAELTGAEDQLGGGASQTGVQTALIANASAGGFAIVDAPAGNANLSAQPGTPTEFSFIDATFGADTISGFDPSRDALVLPQNLVTDFGQLQGFMTEVAGSTLITFSQSQSILITGVVPARLTAVNFEFEPINFRFPAAVAQTSVLPSALRPVADFAGNGAAELLLRSTNTGVISLWGGAIGSASWGSQDLAVVGSDWTTQGAGDFTGTDRASILWRNSSSGDVQLWNPDPAQALAFVGQDLGQAGANWRTQGVADFTGAGRAGILWRDSNTGDVQLWNPAPGGTVSFAGQDLGVVGWDWSIVGSGDFRGNGMSDILWRNTVTDDVYVWQFDPGSGAFAGTDFGTVSLSWTLLATADFNGDGKADLLWQNVNSRDVQIWQSVPGAIGFTGQDFGIVGAGWSFLSAGDFGGAGRADILWQNAAGDVQEWNASAAPVSLTGSLGSAGSEWSVAGTGDFNADHATDVLWRNADSGDVALWIGDPARPGQFAVGDLGIAGGNWQIQGTGDFTGDGVADILWRDANSGDLQLWNATPGGTSPFAGQDLGPIGLDWTVAATADFSGNGKTSILWRNALSGDVSLWQSNAGNGVSFKGVDLGVAGPDWSLLGTGDFTGDGKADILWRNTNDGDVSLWTSAPGSDSFGVQDIGNVGSGWAVAGLGDFTGDGKADILWRNSGSGDVSLWASNSGASVSFTAEDLGVVAANETVAGIGDFNDSGRDGILWRDQAGNLTLWNSSGSVAFGVRDLGMIGTAHV